MPGRGSKARVAVWVLPACAMFGVMPDFMPGAVAAEPVNPFARAEVPSGAPKNSPPPPTAKLTLAGTLTGAGSPFANINGQLYELGERVSGYRIVEIGPDNAVLERRGQRIDLPIEGAKPQARSNR